MTAGPAGPDPTGPDPTARRERGVWVFFLLAYALTWAWLVPVALSGGVVTAGTGWPTHVPALLGPALAAGLLTARAGGLRGLGELGRHMVRVRVPLRWWAFALSPLVLLLVVVGVDAITRHPQPAAADFAMFSGLPSGWGALLVGSVIVLVNGFGEEAGWRGYALPHLQRTHSPLAATIIVATLWIGWHAPMFLVVSTFRSFTAPSSSDGSSGSAAAPSC